MTSTSTLRDAARAALAATDRSVVRIGRAPGRGCGVVVGEGFVLTNAHNLRDRTTEVSFADGRAVQAEVVGVDPDGDLVVLAVDTGGRPTAGVVRDDRRARATSSSPSAARRTAALVSPTGS